MKKYKNSNGQNGGRMTKGTREIRSKRDSKDTFHFFFGTLYEESVTVVRYIIKLIVRLCEWR